MEKLILKHEKIQRLINKILLIISAVMAVVLLTGTIFGLVRSSDAAPLFTLRNNRPGQAAQQDDIRVFAGLGRLRIPLSNSTTLILTITFPYPANDVSFSEELAAKLGDLKAAATGYFSALPEADIIQINEDIAKQEILKRFNANLRLGRISVLYFGDMLVID